MTKQQRKKLADKNPVDADEPIALNDTGMPAAPSTSANSVSKTTDSVRKPVADRPPPGANKQSSSTANSAPKNVDKNGTTASNDFNSLSEEIKSLREKNLVLQNELLYQRETSIRKY